MSELVNSMQSLGFHDKNPMMFEMVLKMNAKRKGGNTTFVQFAEDLAHLIVRQSISNAVAVASAVARYHIHLCFFAPSTPNKSTVVMPSSPDMRNVDTLAFVWKMCGTHHVAWLQIPSIVTHPKQVPSYTARFPLCACVYLFPCESISVK